MDNNRKWLSDFGSLEDVFAWLEERGITKRKGLVQSAWDALKRKDKDDTRDYLLRVLEKDGKVRLQLRKHLVKGV